MKKLILSLLCLMSLTMVKAQSYDYLTFLSNSGDESSVSALGTVITFSNGNMIVKNGTEEMTFALSDLNKFYFAETPTGIDSVNTNDDKAFDVYTVSGQYVGRFAEKSAIKQSVPGGVYVVKNNNTTEKIWVK